MATGPRRAARGRQRGRAVRWSGRDPAGRRMAATSEAGRRDRSTRSTICSCRGDAMKQRRPRWPMGSFCSDPRTSSTLPTRPVLRHRPGGVHRLHLEMYTAGPSTGPATSPVVPRKSTVGRRPRTTLREPQSHDEVACRRRLRQLHVPRQTTSRQEHSRMAPMSSRRCRPRPTGPRPTASGRSRPTG